jgi:hypothetical protein
MAVDKLCPLLSDEGHGVPLWRLGVLMQEGRNMLNLNTLNRR